MLRTTLSRLCGHHLVSRLLAHLHDLGRRIKQQLSNGIVRLPSSAGQPTPKAGSARSALPDAKAAPQQQASGASQPQKKRLKKKAEPYSAICPDQLLRHPFFILKSGQDPAAYDHQQRNGILISIEVEPDPDLGRPTIDDRDLLIYAITRIMADRSELTAEPKEISFRVIDFLHAVGRSTGRTAYDQVDIAIRRLNGARFRSSVATGEACSVGWFCLCQASMTPGGDHGPRVISIILSDWVWRSLLRETELRAYHPEAFALRPLAKRVYDLARVCCGEQPLARYNLMTVHKMVGTSMPLAEFRRHLKRVRWVPGPSGLAETGYGVSIVEQDGVSRVMIYSDRPRPRPVPVGDELFAAEQQDIDDDLYQEDVPF